ncbi:hypothetical protein ABZP36_010249 [Zizania latifolia]
MFFGQIPSWIGTSLPLLRILSIQSNNFSGEIPADLYKLSQLQLLDMANNRLTGFIPTTFGNLSSMTQTKTMPITQSSEESTPSQQEIQQVPGPRRGRIPSNQSPLDQYRDNFACAENQASAAVRFSRGPHARGAEALAPAEVRRTRRRWALATAEQRKCGERGDEARKKSAAAAIHAPGNAAGPSQGEVLLAWKASLQDDAAALSGWTRAAPVCGWGGVGCDAAGHVVTLRLRGMGLGGGLDKLNFAAFLALTELDLNGNYNLNGTIPASISWLSSLELLDLDSNGFIGSIPSEFGDLSGLVELRLYNNNLVGVIPHQLSRLPKIYPF